MTTTLLVQKNQLTHTRLAITPDATLAPDQIRVQVDCFSLTSNHISHTAYGMAFRLQNRPGIEVIGLTAAVNQAFCESLGCYSRVLTDGQLDRIAADTAQAAACLTRLTPVNAARGPGVQAGIQFGAR